MPISQFKRDRYGSAQILISSVHTFISLGSGGISFVGKFNPQIIRIGRIRKNDKTAFSIERYQISCSYSSIICKITSDEYFSTALDGHTIDDIIKSVPDIKSSIYISSRIETSNEIYRSSTICCKGSPDEDFSIALSCYGIDCSIESSSDIERRIFSAISVETGNLIYYCSAICCKITSDDDFPTALDC